MRLPSRPGGHVAGEEKRLKLYEAILAERAAGRRPPSHRELATTIGCSPSTVRFHLRALRALGLLEIEPGTRGVHILSGTKQGTGRTDVGPVPFGGSRATTLGAVQPTVKTATDELEQKVEQNATPATAGGAT